MANFTLVIDNRERAIIEHYNSSGLLSDSLKVATLQVGDIHITRDETTTLVVIERKSIADFYQSVRDGRYREQKVRLLAFPTVHRIYLIEGTDMNDQRGQFPENYLDQLLIRASLKDGIQVFRTTGISDTIRWIDLLFEKVQSQPELYEKTANTTAVDSYVSKVSVAKKDCLTPEICYKLQLKQIPGVSSATAEAIYAIAPNWKSLVTRFELNGTHALSEIQPVSVTTSTNGKRKLGNKLSEKIHSFVINTL